MEGRFRLGIIPTVAPYLLPHVLPELKARFPGAAARTARGGDGRRWSRKRPPGRIDGFVAACRSIIRDWSPRTLFDDRFFLAVPAGDPGFASPPVPPESPALERLMLLEEGHCLREQALAVCGSVKPVAMASYGATSLTTLLQMVAHGLGVTLIPEMASGPAGDMRDLKIVPFAEPMPARNVCLAWRRNSPRQEECVELAKIIRGLRSTLLPDAP